MVNININYCEYERGYGQDIVKEKIEFTLKVFAKKLKKNGPFREKRSVKNGIMITFQINVKLMFFSKLNVVYFRHISSFNQIFKYCWLF